MSFTELLNYKNQLFVLVATSKISLNLLILVNMKGAATEIRGALVLNVT